MERSNHSKAWKHFAQNNDQATCRQWCNYGGTGVRTAPHTLVG